MKESLRVLLSGIVDYAGTFPPARLSFEETVQNYLRYRDGEQAWMLGNLVTSLEMLGDLPNQIETKGGDTDVLPASLVLGGAEATNLLLIAASSKIDVEEHQRHLARATVVDAIEVRMRQDDLAAFSYVASLPFATQALPLSTRGVSCYFEPPESDWKRNCRFLLERLTERQPKDLRPRIAGDLHTRHFGVKLRTGGLDAAAFPSVDAIAFVIARCRDTGVPWKATAGLHHPLRHHDDSIGVMMHGFLNVACAAVLAEASGLTESQIAEVLKDESIESFEFRDDGFRWRDLEATMADIARCREYGFQSFGSCSFEEPIEGLSKLGLL